MQLTEDEYERMADYIRVLEQGIEQQAAELERQRGRLAEIEKEATMLTTSSRLRPSEAQHVFNILELAAKVEEEAG